MPQPVAALALPVPRLDRLVGLVRDEAADAIDFGLDRPAVRLLCDVSQHADARIGEELRHDGK